MAIGDDAAAAGYPLVPNSGEGGQVKWGAREINRTRDFVAQVKNLVPANESAARIAAGITSGSEEPNNSNGENGDIYFRIV